MPYLIQLEKAGIPTILIDFDDQDIFVEEEARTLGMPKLRYMHASRTLRGPEDVDIFLKPMFEGLTRPLTKEEMESGMWSPEHPRIIFEGTLDEAQEFYQQVDILPGLLNAPYSRYTDGLPIIVPTEEKVAEMLKGTSHKPDEVITLQSEPAKVTAPEAVGGEPPMSKGEAVRYMPLRRVANVEQVAANAVMAGCKPEHLPIVLAMAEASAGTGDGRDGQGFVVSGPIAEDIGMNFGFGLFGPGNPANKSIARTANLMWRNLGGAIPSVTVTSNWGGPATNGGFVFAEYADGLPKGWLGLNEEYGYKKDESIIMATRPGSWGIGQFFMPGVYRALQKDGHGAMARKLGVKGIPGPHNWLEYLCEGLWATMEGGITLVMVPEMAQHLADIGFKSKDEVCEWIWKKSFETVGEYRMRGRPDFATNGWTSIEKTSGKRWLELDDDYMVPAGGDMPRANCILICGGEEETVNRFGGGHGPVFNVDVWR
ncbi:hypothetical protein ACFLYN_00950 [Chloroflexota bacterium]